MRSRGRRGRRARICRTERVWGKDFIDYNAFHITDEIGVRGKEGKPGNWRRPSSSSTESHTRRDQCWFLRLENLAQSLLRDDYDHLPLL